MAKFVINLKPGLTPADFNDKDILMYDSKNDYFYRVTPNKFFDEYEKKLDKLLTRYDSIVTDLRDDFKNQEKENEAFKKTIQETNYKLIEMVENFIKGGKS